MCGGLDVHRGAAGCAALRSALLPAPGVRPQSRRGVEGAERPAPSQAPAGGAPGHSARSSRRPLLEPPRDRPEVRAWMLRRPTGSLILSPARPVSHMPCHLERINLSKLMIDALHSPAQLPRKLYFSAHRPGPRTPRGSPITPTPGSLTAQILWGPHLRCLTQG